MCGVQLIALKVLYHYTTKALGGSSGHLVGRVSAKSGYQAATGTLRYMAAALVATSFSSSIHGLQAPTSFAFRTMVCSRYPQQVEKLPLMSTSSAIHYSFHNPVEMGLYRLYILGTCQTFNTTSVALDLSRRNEAIHQNRTTQRARRASWPQP